MHQRGLSGAACDEREGCDQIMGIEPQVLVGMERRRAWKGWDLVVPGAQKH